MAERLSKEQWLERKNETMDNLYGMIGEQVEKTLTDKFELKTYLHAQGRLGKTSLANTMLVCAQMPDARYIAGYDDWQSKERSVKKGEKGIQVIEAGREYTRKDGSVGVGFLPKKVFDVSQTQGKPLQERNFSKSVEKHICRELQNTEMQSEFEGACVKIVVNARYGVAGKDQLPDIPEDIQNFDSKEKRELLQDIREGALDVMERVNAAYFEERQKQKNEQSR